MPQAPQLMKTPRKAKKPTHIKQIIVDHQNNSSLKGLELAQSRIKTASLIKSDLIKLGDLRNEERDEYRVELINKYSEHVGLVLGADQSEPDEVTGWVVVWLWDVGKIEQFLDLAPKAVAKKQQTPKVFKTNLSEFVMYKMIDWSRKQRDQGHSPRPLWDQAYLMVTQAQEPVDKAVAADAHKEQARVCFELDYTRSETDEEKKQALGQAILGIRQAEKLMADKAKVKTFKNEVASVINKAGWNEIILDPKFHP